MNMEHTLGACKRKKDLDENAAAANRGMIFTNYRDPFELAMMKPRSTAWTRIEDPDDIAAAVTTADVSKLKKNTDEKFAVIDNALSELKELTKTTDKEIDTLQGKLATLQGVVGVDVPEVQQGIKELKDNMTKLRNDFPTLEYNSAHQYLSVNALQGYRCEGEFVWKIQDIREKVSQIQMGTTKAVHSVPFRTSEFGYKMCAGLGLYGHGDNKTHISLYIVVMKGEHDDVLRWPFLQKITMMVLDRDSNGIHIIQSFRPNSSTKGFGKPKKDMNTPCGCPKFAPMSLLRHPRYVKNNTLFIKIIVDKNGIDKA